MEQTEITALLDQIEALTGKDKVLRHLLLSALISKLFAERNVGVVVVGGSAMEFYTEGRYMSRDIDFACRNLSFPDCSYEVMRSIGATPYGIKPDSRPPLGHRTYVLDRFEVTVDLCGHLEMSKSAMRAGIDCRTLETPMGPVCIFPPEELIADRLVSATQPKTDPDRLKVAALLIHFYRNGLLADDAPGKWDLVEKICNDPDYDVLAVLRRITGETP